MYIWIGCAVPEAFAAPLRSFCQAHNRDLGLNTAAFALPQHISLKISFETREPELVLALLEENLSREQRFVAEFTEIQRMGSVLWLSVGENPHLQRLHQQLDTLLRDRFGIPLHRFDLDFQFHSTLFIDSDEMKLEEMRHRIENYPIATPMTIDTCLLGTSPDGSPGSYQVVRKFNFL